MHPLFMSLLGKSKLRVAGLRLEVWTGVPILSATSSLSFVVYFWFLQKLCSAQLFGLPCKI